MLKLRETVHWIFLGASLALVSTGCVLSEGGDIPGEEDFDDGDSESELPPTDGDDLPPTISDGTGPELITVAGDDSIAPGQSLGDFGDSKAPASVPCSCPEGDYECLADWANGQFGCEVCVTILCGGAPGPHVCTGNCE